MAGTRDERSIAARRLTVVRPRPERSAVSDRLDIETMHELRRRWIDRGVVGTRLTCDLDSGLEVRQVQSMLAGARTATNRQSPPTVGTWEYQRDRHEVGVGWETEWIAQLDWLGERQALLTNCGMAAISTTLAYMERSLPSTGTVLVDAGVYHETRHLLATGALAARCVLVGTDELSDSIDRWNPSAVFVDAITNRPDVRVADLRALRCALERRSPEAILVVDVSLCSMMDPWARRQLDAFETPLIVVESLTKHAQLGLDRIPGGLIVSDAARVEQLDRLREHVGSNITDLACAALPDPNRSLMLRRLDRQASNATLLASQLCHAGLPAAHPTLSNHPDHGHMARQQNGDVLDRCPGPNVVIVGLSTASDTRAVERAMVSAERRGLLLENGVGFGFDSTRIYQTSQSIPEASAFVRISPGIEPIDVIEHLGEAIIEAFA